MKNNKGFTLIEILAVITILSILIIIAFPAISNIQTRMKTNAYCTKIIGIEHAAVLWGQDNRSLLQTISGTYSNKTAMLNAVTLTSSKITVQTLINGNYLKKDDDTKVINPIDNSGMNSLQIKVFIRNSRVEAGIPSAITTCS